MEDYRSYETNQEPKMQIVITQGTEYQSRVEDIYCPNIFFHSAYKQAADCVESILQVGQEPNWIKTTQFQESSSDLELNDKLLGYPNNVIAFCAERGQGKTSAMVSFAKALSGLTKATQEKWINFSDKPQPLAPQYRFEVLNSIDPTSIVNHQSILDVILSRMFSLFQDAWEQQYCRSGSLRGQDDTLNQRRSILQAFQKCYSSLHAVYRESLEEDDALERMMELGDSGNIRGSLYRLVSAYLNFTQRTEQSYLVLQIDDADLSLGDTFQLIDQIRRNLIIPRVIVLLAANMFQLESTVEQHFIKQYEQSIKLHGMVSTETCHNIAARYLDKVIPSTRQIYLPDLGKLIAQDYGNIQIKYESREDGQTNLLEEGNDRELRYQDQLLRFLHQRTGLILLNPKNHLHNLLPGNMRELAHFLPYFQELPPLRIGYRELIYAAMDPFFLDRKAVDDWLSNLNRLKSYLINIWAPTNLHTEEHQFLKGLFRYEDANLHRYVLDFLPDYYASGRLRSVTLLGNSSAHSENYRQIFTDQCAVRGLRYYEGQAGKQYASYVDVMEALNVLSRLPDAQRHYKFIYAIRIYYTVQMHHLLLEQILSLGSQGLSEFLGDVLWRKDDVEDNLVRTRYGHYMLDSQELSTCLDKLISDASNISKRTISLDSLISSASSISKSNMNQQCQGYIRAFCRKKVLRHNFYSFASIQNTDLRKDSPSKSFYFHLFYPCLLDLEILLGAGTAATKDGVKSSSVLQDRILGSMILLLNWDVQYILSRWYRGEGKADSNALENVLLPRLLRATYYSTPMTRTFESIKRATGEEWNEDLFRSMSEKNTDQEIISWSETNERMDPAILSLYAIQFCVPELRQYFINYCKDAVSAFDASLKVLHRRNFERNATLRSLYRSKSQNALEDSIVQAIGTLYSFAINADTPLWAFIQMQRPKGRKIPHEDEQLINLTPSQLREFVRSVKALINEVMPLESAELKTATPQVQDTLPCMNCQINIDRLVGQLQELFSNAAIVKLEPINSDKQTPKD